MSKKTKIRHAVYELEFAIERIAELLETFGWSYKVTEEARDSYSKLGIKRQVLLSSIGTKTSFYQQDYNILFRFWHDVLHITLKKSFIEEDERYVIQHQIDTLKMYGVSELAIRIFTIDTLGQLDYYIENKEFVEDQTEFMLKELKYGTHGTTTI